MFIVRGETASRTAQRKGGRMHDLVEGLYAAHAAELTAALALSVRDRWAAEDLAHEVFVLALAEERRLRDHPNPRAWLFRTGYNLARNRRSLLWRRRHKVARQAPVLSDEGWGELLDLRAAMRALSPRQRDAITLHCYLGLGVEDTAELLGCGVGTAKTHQHRGRATLDQLLRPKEATS